MSEPREPHRLPTLTEVVPIAPPPPVAPPPVVPAPAAVPAAAAPLPPAAEIVEQVLADVQRQVGLVLEYRLREALTAAIARATDTLAREARNELSVALREIVERAVAQELQRHRDRSGPR